MPGCKEGYIASYDLLFEEYCNLCRDLREKGCFENENLKDEELQLEARARLEQHIDRLILHAEHQKRRAILTSDNNPCV
ncbi:MAG: hypothetical protein EOP48_06765 [Sphingobacteriales bacterium]|nr:MAG: hypothetical protein EOP48_06765 [Sphingobacteriales bacterium]